MARLGDVCLIQAGGTPSRSNGSYWEGGTIPWVKISDFDGKRLSSVSEYITEQGLNNSSAKLFCPGTILYTIFATLGETCILDMEATTNQAIAGLQITDDRLTTEYLYYFLVAQKDYVNEIGRGVAQNNINLGILRNMQIDIPSIEIQHQVTQSLDKVDALISLRKQQIAKLDELVKARFVEMFCAIDDAKTWPYQTIADISADMRTGPFGSALHHDEFVNSGVFVLGIDNAVENKFSYNRMRYITEEKYQQLKRYTVYPGDVIITIMGTVGRSAVIPNDIPKAINTKHLACITPNIAVVNPQFLSCAFQFHPDVRAQLQIQCKGAIMDGLNLTIIKGLSFHIPPLELQHQFAAFVAQTDQQRLTIQHSLAQLELLKKALMQKYFG